MIPLSLSCSLLPYYVPKILPLPVSLGQKWWPTVLEIEISCSQWDGQHALMIGPGFSFFGGGGAWGEFFFFSSLFNSAPAVSSGQKCWPTVLEIKNTCIQWVGWSMHSRKFWARVWGEGFFSFFFVPNMFPSSSQWHLALIPYVLPIVLPFLPIYRWGFRV